MAQYSPDAAHKVDNLFNDLEYFAESQLVIKPKVGELQSLKFNRAQKYIHSKLEAQKKRTGRVRALILKGRQQGCSTYVSARYYHLTTTSRSTLTFIFAHDTEASQSLFGMVKTYYDASKSPSFRPQLGASNAKELLFPALQSGYKVGTAGTKGMGRSKTFQLLHWSEVAYSPHPDDHASGILQTVSDVAETEIILESTAKGQGDYFHRTALLAMSGENDYEMIFVPWYWQDEYKRAVTDDFLPTLDENETHYWHTFKKDGLTAEHLAWRRNKIQMDFQGDAMRFKREYPFTPQEAFEASDEDAWIKSILIEKARATPYIPTTAPIIMGVDPAAEGGDKFKIVYRQGRNIIKIERLPPMRVDQSAELIAQRIEKHKPQLVNIDVGGLGLGVHDILVGKGYKAIVKKVNFGGTLELRDNVADANMTAQMFRDARAWLEDEPCSITCSEADGMALQSELSARKHEWPLGKLKMESKKEFKKRLTYSPDTGDAFLLTFAFIVPNVAVQNHFHQPIKAKTDGWNPFQ